MYTKGQLDRFAEQIPDAGDKALFKERIAKIAFQKQGEIEICNAAKLDEALVDSGVEHFAEELSSRIAEFISFDDFSSPH